MIYIKYKLLIAIAFCMLICFPSNAAEPVYFGEHAEGEEIRGASDYCTVLQLPDGDACEVFYKRSDGSSFAAKDSPDGGVYYLNLLDGYEISYAFLADEGEETLYLQEGIVEPVYIESYNKQSKGPVDWLVYTHNNREGSRIMYDLPSGYEYHSKDGHKLKIQRIIKITSLATGKYTEIKDEVITLSNLEYREPDAERRMNQTDMYEVKQGDSLWNISKQVYGTPGKWTSIYNANQHCIKNPDLIYAGQKLAIP